MAHYALDNEPALALALAAAYGSGGLMSNFRMPPELVSLFGLPPS
jgi:hypothetical protein